MPVIAPQDNYSISKINYGNQFKNNYNTAFSIGISIPLLNNFKNKTQIKTAVLLEKDAEITLNASKNTIAAKYRTGLCKPVTSAQKPLRCTYRTGKCL